MEWKEVRLGDTCDIQAGGDAPKGRVSKIKTSPFCIPIYSNGTADEGLYGYTDEAKIFEPATTISARGTIGVAFRRTEPYYPIVRLISVIGHKEYFDSDFLYYCLKNSYIAGDGSVQAQLTVPMISDYIVKIPNLSDQRRIASILSSLDRKIELNNKINAQLEEMAQAIFKSWFVDFEPFKDGKFVESELGMIPEGWRVLHFLDIVDLKPGGTPKTDVEEYWTNGNIPFFSPKDVTGVFCYDTEKHITELGLDNCSSQYYPRNTVFITCRGTVGKVAMAAVPMAMNQSNYAIVGKTGYGQFYIYFATLSIVERLLKKANGAVFSAITSKDFKESIIVPQLSVIDKFNVFIAPLFEKIHILGNENLRLSQLRDTLLPKLMSGEIELD